MANLNNDIERYLRGDLSPAEMHDLEKRALRDPFLAEALEGAEHAGAESFAIDMQLLNRSIREKTKRKKRPKYLSLNNWGLYMGIAAGLLLLTVSYFIIWSIIGQQNKQELASKEAAKPEPAAIAADSVTASKQDSLLIAYKYSEPVQAEKDVEKQGKKIKESNAFHLKDPKEEKKAVNPITGYATDRGEETPVESKDKDQTTSPVVIMADETANPSQEKQEGIAGATRAEADEDAERGKSLRKAQDQVPALAKQRSALSKILKGKVTSAEDGLPLTGVNVLIKGTSIGTVTDIEGNYELPVNDPQQQLVFSFIGLTSKEVNIGSNQEVNVELNADVTQLSELVVVSDAKKVQADEPQYLAEPEGGRHAYKQYLEEKLHYPQQAIANNVEGKVTVQFTVEANGQLSDFKVLKGLGYGCDDEVIRLIKQGPAWSPTKRNNAPVKDKVRVRLKFDLPEKR